MAGEISETTVLSERTGGNDTTSKTEQKKKGGKSIIWSLFAILFWSLVGYTIYLQLRVLKQVRVTIRANMQKWHINNNIIVLLYYKL